jgi:hypothetical protein
MDDSGQNRGQPLRQQIEASLSLGLAVGQKLLAEASHRARTLEEDLRARREVDVEGMVAGLRARLSEQLSLEPLPIDSDLSEKRAHLGLGSIRTQVFRSEKLRKIVLSHVAVPTVLEGLALTLLPQTDLDAPCFAADLMALPWRISVNADVYGRDWQTRDALKSARTTFFRLGSGAGPTWSAKLGSAHGLHARLRPRQVEEGFAALSQGLAAYLTELGDAPPGRSQVPQEQFFLAFHQNGPRTRGALRKLFGEDWVERYSRLLFE